MLEQLASMDANKLLAVVGAGVGILLVTQLSAFGAGLGWVIKTAFRAGEHNAIQKRLKSDMDAAHKKIRELESRLDGEC